MGQQKGSVYYLQVTVFSISQKEGIALEGLTLAKIYSISDVTHVSLLHNSLARLLKWSLPTTRGLACAAYTCTKNREELEVFGKLYL